MSPEYIVGIAQRHDQALVTCHRPASGFGGGMLRGADRGLLAVTLRVPTLRWRHVFWTVGEVIGGIAVGPRISHLRAGERVVHTVASWLSSWTHYRGEDQYADRLVGGDIELRRR